MAVIKNCKLVKFDEGKDIICNFAEPIGDSQEIIRVSEDGEKWAIVKAKTGEFISGYQYTDFELPREYPYVFGKDYDRKNIIIVGQNEDDKKLYGAINYKGEVIIPIKYTQYCLCRESIIPSLYASRILCGIMNKFPRLVIIVEDSEGNQGAFDSYGNIIIPFGKESIRTMYGSEVLK